MKHLYEIIDKSQAYPNQTALTYQNYNITFGTLKESIDRLASGLLGLGIQSGDRIALMLPNIPQFVISYFALLKIGVTILPLSIYDKAEEVHHQLEDAEVKGVIYWHGFRETVLHAVNRLEPHPLLIVLGQPQADEQVLTRLIEESAPHTESIAVDPNETAVVVYTAGTTGRPKGAELTHRNILANIRMCAEYLKLTADDGVVGVIPLYQPLGQTLVMGTFLASGARISLIPKFESVEVVEKISSEKLTCMIGVPSMYRELCELEIETAPDFTHVRYCLSSGDAMSSEVRDLFKEKFHLPIVEGYALTEASPVVSFNDPLRETKSGSIGLPLLGVDVRIVNEQGEEVNTGEVGEVIVKGANVMKGYLNRPEATKDAIRDEWLYTGDLALLDESGYGIIVARKNNLIVKSGFSIYPREVEKFLLGYPKIKEAGVFGLPDKLAGEEIFAAVVLKDGEGSTEEEIKAYLKERMAAYKCPKKISFVTELPRGPSGRLYRETLKQNMLN